MFRNEFNHEVNYNGLHAREEKTTGKIKWKLENLQKEKEKMISRVEQADQKLIQIQSEKAEQLKEFAVVKEDCTAGFALFQNGKKRLRNSPY